MASAFKPFPDGKDPSGNPVIYVYATKRPAYIVYRDPMRVMVHFAEDPQTEARQRTALAALNPLRGQISGLLDSWRRSRDSYGNGLVDRMRMARDARNEARACRYDRRVADALIMGLEGSVCEAVALLTDIRNDVIAERKSIAQTDYLLWAAFTGLLFVLAVWALSAGLALVASPPPHVHLIWTGAAAGAIGACFSIAIGLRKREILIDLQKWDNRTDAMLRVAVGTIGAAILLCLLLANWVVIAGVTQELMGGDGIVRALAIGFIAGFSERAVGDLLGRAGNTISEEATNRDIALEQAKAAATVAAHSSPAAQPGRAPGVRADAAGGSSKRMPQADAEQVAGEVVVTVDEAGPVVVGIRADLADAKNAGDHPARDPKTREREPAHRD